MSLKDVFVIRESSNDWTDPQYYGMDPESETNRGSFYEKYKTPVMHGDGSKLPLSDYLLYLDDLMGDWSLRQAITAGEWQEVERIARQLQAEHGADPGSFHDHALDQVKADLGDDDYVRVSMSSRASSKSDKSYTN